MSIVPPKVKPVAAKPIASSKPMVVMHKEMADFTRISRDPTVRVKPSGSPDVDVAAELDEVGSEIGITNALSDGFRRRKSQESDRMIKAVDAERWVLIAFETYMQKKEFLELVGWADHGDKYLDGRVIAKRMGVTLPESGRTYNTSDRVDSRLSSLAKPVNYRK